MGILVREMFQVFEIVRKKERYLYMSVIKKEHWLVAREECFYKSCRPSFLLNFNF